MTSIFSFRKSKGFKTFRILRLLLCFTIVVLFIIASKYFYKLNFFSSDISKLSITSSNELTKETLVKEFRNVNKLIPLEIELSETLILDNTYFNLDIFKKSKKITFFANCAYCIDFSNLSSDDIELNDISKEILIKIPQPEIFSISIDESKTIYDEPELGLLRFGDLDLSSEDLKKMNEKLYDSFSTKMKDSIFYDQAISNTQSSLEKLLLNLTNEYYKITLIL